MLENGDRLENASWRRWYQRKYNIQQISKKEIVSMKKHSKLSKETPSAPCLEEILGSPWNDKTLDGHSKSEPTTLKLKKKKKVRFDESKNQTTFLWLAFSYFLLFLIFFFNFHVHFLIYLLLMSFLF